MKGTRNRATASPATHGSRLPETTAERAPARTSEIPGLGPIRIRTLYKAGYTSVESLKTATVELLAAVPGITEIKARYILNYLAQFSLDGIRSASIAAGRADQSTVITQWESVATQISVSPVALEAARTLGAVIRLLIGPHALRNRLLSAIDRYGMECQALIVEAVTISEREEEPGLRRMRKTTEALIEAAGSQEFNKRDQGNTADDLAEMSTWIAGLRTASKARERRPAAEV